VVRKKGSPLPNLHRAATTTVETMVILVDSEMILFDEMNTLAAQQKFYAFWMLMNKPTEDTFKVMDLQTMCARRLINCVHKDSIIIVNAVYEGGGYKYTRRMVRRLGNFLEDYRALLSLPLSSLCQKHLVHCRYLMAYFFYEEMITRGVESLVRYNRNLLKRIIENYNHQMSLPHLTADGWPVGDVDEYFGTFIKLFEQKYVGRRGIKCPCHGIPQGMMRYSLSVMSDPSLTALAKNSICVVGCVHCKEKIVEELGDDFGKKLCLYLGF